jgi:hypothetical protein
MRCAVDSRSALLLSVHRKLHPKSVQRATAPGIVFALTFGFGSTGRARPSASGLMYRPSSAIQHGNQHHDRSEAVPQIKSQRVPFFGD